MPSASPHTILAFDICGSGANIALVAGTQCLGTYQCVDRRAVADTLPAGLDELLKVHGLTMADIAWLATTTGPGSYTGLRGVLALVKGLALAMTLPVLAITAFDCMAIMAKAQPGDALLIDAGRGRLWRQSCGPGGWPAGAIEPWADSPSVGRRVIGAPDALNLASTRAGPRQFEQLPIKFDALSVAQVAIDLRLAGHALQSGVDVLPLYLAPAEAHLSPGKSLIETRT